MELVDTHCHIHFDDYPFDAKTVISNAAAAGVTKLICVGCSLSDSRLAVDFAAAHKNVWASVGAHPHDGADFLSDPKGTAKFKELLACPKVVAVGEIGLDYYHQNSSKADQEKSLRAQIEASSELGLPYIFHVRDAWEDFWRILDDYKIDRGVIHSFSAGPEHLDEVLKRGLYVGLNGIMTFTKDEAQLKAAKQVPLNRLLLETDAPFLTPKPFRGQTCEPKHARTTAEFLAGLRGESLDKIAAATSANVERLFGI